MTFRVTEGSGNINDSTNEIVGGCFLTSVDIFFSHRDENIPVIVKYGIHITDNLHLNYYLLVEW